MGVRVLYDNDENLACLYDSVTMTAFGRIFSEDEVRSIPAFEVAERFVDWLSIKYGEDPRRLALANLLNRVEEYEKRTS